MKQLAIENKESYPIASQCILNDFFVDDLLTGSNELNEVKTRYLQVYSILKSSHFILRKWNSNCTELLSNFVNSEKPNAALRFGENESFKTLGIQWIVQVDTLNYKIKQFDPSCSVTKRHILSVISQIYDPLGLISPCIVIAKLIIQKLWSYKIQ